MASPYTDVQHIDDHRVPGRPHRQQRHAERVHAQRHRLQLSILLCRVWHLQTRHSALGWRPGDAEEANQPDLARNPSPSGPGGIASRTGTFLSFDVVLDHF